MKNPVIVQALRTPIGRARKGSLITKDAFALAQVVVAAVVERAKFDPSEIDDIVTGLENISYKGVIHPQTGFDKESHDVLEGRYVMPLSQWQEGGKQVVFWPEQFKLGNYVKPAWWK